ncbi:MAG: hypothetical protein K1X36_02060 [Pyrinomonadaceae bacterium]|nr:hypothetical protein [Pyrinomonadaceae bacterium]
MTEIAVKDTPAEHASPTVREAWFAVLREPSLFIRHWNYKGAVLSSAFRAPIFLVTYLAARESLKLAVAAAAVQFTFRFLFAGLTGYLIQAMRRVEPAWKAVVSILLVVPLVSHLFEFLVQAAFVHYTETSDYTGKAIVRSIVFSIFSSLFAFYIMRRNVLIVGEHDSRSLFSDVLRLPRLVWDFMSFVPDEMLALLRRGAYAGAAIAFIAWGLFSQMVGWALTSRSIWTYGGGKDLGILKYWGVDGLILMAIAVVLAQLRYSYNERRGLKNI